MTGRKGRAARGGRTASGGKLAVFVSNRSAGERQRIARGTGRGRALLARALRGPRRAALRTALRSAARGKAGGAVDVIWVDDGQMRELCRRFGGPRGTTDVLAFEGGIDPETGARPLGEIVCNLELARASARAHGNSAEAEAVLYATHGLLHLLGESDGTPGGRRRMREAERAALAAAGLEVRGGEWD